MLKKILPKIYSSQGRWRGLKIKRNRAAEAWQESLLVGYKNPTAPAEATSPDWSWQGLIVLIGLSVIILGAQLFRLQVVEGARLTQVAEGNRLRQKVTYAPRGRIFDRNGKELAQNRPSFQLVAYPYLLTKDESARHRDYQTVSHLSGVALARIKKLVEKRGLSDTQPVLLKDHIAYNPALILEQKLPSVEGFSVDGVPVREYQSDSGLGHVLGYVGRASEDDIKSDPKLSPVDFVGEAGIEAQYDSLIRGQNGVIKTEIDATGRPLRVISEEPTRAGQDIMLSIDYGLQRSFAAAILSQMQRAGVKRAAGVALDPESGEVLASVSLPSYDNNLFSGGISPQNYQRLLDNPLEVLHDKVIGGGYPSGSIIKPLHLSAALQEKVVDENTIIVDRGKIVVPSEFDPSVEYTFRGWNPGGLGPMNARRALAMSSDIYFYTVGGGYQGFHGLGVDRLTEYYQKFGLGQLTGIDLPGEAAGRVPTPAWKKQTTGEDWFVGDTYNISIGQGDMLTSPLQMAVATAAVANGGKLLQPHVFKQTVDGQLIKETKVNRQGFIDPKYLKIAREGMRQVIGGTTDPAVFAGVPVSVAGKSGTAETDPNTQRRSHAWYTAFAPYDKPKVVFALILEEGEGGSQFAAPAIAQAMEWYFKHPARR